MIKLIEIVGKDNLKLIHEKCDALIEYTETDVTTRRVLDDYSGGHEYCSLTCPNCGEIIQWKSKK